MGKYALTEQERKWLEERKKRTQHCDTCPNRVGYYELCSSCRSRSLYGLSLCPDYRDAAEFEARVSRYIAENASKLYCSNSWQFLDGFKAKSLAWYILWEARIVVEVEMENDSTGMA